MNILIVCTGNFGYIKPFVSEQVDALKKEGINIDYFLIQGKGVFGYLKNLSPLKKQIKKNKYNLIHAHYGLSGLLACLQRKKPVVITFHTGEQFKWYINFLASLAVLLAKKCIYVSSSTYKDIFFKIKKKTVIIPCGVNTEIFKPQNIENIIKPTSIIKNKINILFASDFTKTKAYKNANLAIKSVNKIKNANLIELKNYSREEVNLLLNSCNLLLLTSTIEGSPQIVKEAMACNCPVVATNVGDIKEIFNEMDGHFITNFTVEDVTKKINQAIKLKKKTQGRQRVLKKYDNAVIAKQIINIYKSLI